MTTYIKTDGVKVPHTLNLICKPTGGGKSMAFESPIEIKNLVDNHDREYLKTLKYEGYNHRVILSYVSFKNSWDHAVIKFDFERGFMYDLYNGNTLKPFTERYFTTWKDAVDDATKELTQPK